MFYDMHVHSNFSTDSVLDMERGILTAIDKGFSGIAFTDHLDVDFTDYEDEFHFDFNDYFNTINSLKDKYCNQIDVLSAIEIGLQPHVYDETSSLINGFNFDYTIGSTHLIKKADPYCGKYFKPGDNKIESYNIYLEELYNNLVLFNSFKFNTMGHIDYIVRYADFPDSVLYYKDHAPLLDCILKYIIDNNISLEINTSTYIRQPLDTNILKRYKELGGYLITIGSDAHSEDKIGLIFSDYSSLIKECGFNYLFYYKNKQSIAYKI